MIISNTVGKLIVLSFIIICAVLDHKYKKIDIRIFLLMLLVELATYGILYLADIKINYASILAGILVGAFIYVMSKLTGEKIGLGDAFYFTLTGAAMGGLKNICILLGGVLVCAIVGFIMNMKKPILGRKLALLTATLPFGVLAVLAG